MKIKLAAAAATALFAMGAQAQSSVTLYGVADVGVEYLSRTLSDNSLVRMQSGNGITTGSWWGMRGTDDLGGGMKGIFVMESGFNVDNGANTSDRFFNRQIYLGLQSRYGGLTLGRHQTPVYDFTIAFDPMAATSQYSIVNIDPGMASRADNSIKYEGKFGGLTASALYSFGYDMNGEVPGNYKRGREYAASLRYTTGPLNVGVVYDLRQPLDDAKVQRASVALSYAFGPTKVFGGYRWENVTGLSPLFVRSNLYWVGVGYHATPALTLKGSVYYNDFAKYGADPFVFVASAEYAFSKRTSTYLNLGYAYNRTDKGRGSIANLGSLVVPGDNQFGAMVGVRHRF
ncbi:porin [Cupriavidus pauculus]|uniref:porin n=1 Tax=Cupriavidus pauculus TaxID=82633 RepID=UPI001EE23396|nr:porin [Cupriavidus pauculus]GJG95125.1 porin [Cupriavidus pauculus]